MLQLSLRGVTGALVAEANMIVQKNYTKLLCKV
jgi:hypothetical protein